MEEVYRKSVLAPLFSERKEAGSLAESEDRGGKILDI